jgi:hypothetical protein
VKALWLLAFVFMIGCTSSKTVIQTEVRDSVFVQTYEGREIMVPLKEKKNFTGTVFYEGYVETAPTKEHGVRTYKAVVKDTTLTFTIGPDTTHALGVSTVVTLTTSEQAWYIALFNEAKKLMVYIIVGIALFIVAVIVWRKK